MTIEEITERLASFGYTVIGDDTWVIGFLITKVENHILTTCHILVVPVELHEIAVDMVCGEFLSAKKALGALEGYDLAPAVKQIQEGDTNIVYAIGAGTTTPEQRLDILIAQLMYAGTNDLLSFRRIQW